MSNFCVNPNSQQWKDLVSAVGEANARVAYSLHNHYNKTQDQIPDPVTASAILDNRTVSEKDELLLSQSLDFKRQRSIQQATLLDMASRTGSGTRQVNDAQRVALSKFMLMNQRYQNFLTSQIEKVQADPGALLDQTISVTKLVGQGDFKGNPEDYEDFARFGTFIHEVIEQVQVESILDVKDPVKILTREYFDKKLQEHMAKKPFMIQGLEAQEMFDNLFKIAVHITSKYDHGFVVFPELTVFGETHTGTKVVGRLDLVLIDVKGQVHIFDFKTKKVDGMVLDNGMGIKTEVDREKAFEYLATTKYSVIEHGDYVTGYTARTAYDNWYMQLMIYQNLLKQNLLETGSMDIIAWLYEVDKDTRQYLGTDITVFNSESFYDYASHIFKATAEEKKRLVGETTHGTEKLHALKKAASKFIPHPGSEKILEEETPQIIQEDLPINDEQYQNFKKKVLQNLSTQITQVRRQLRQFESMDNLSEEDKVTKDLYQNRLDTLHNIKNVLEKVGDESLAVFKSVNFNQIIALLGEDIAKNSKIAEEVLAKIQNGSPTSKQSNALHLAYRKSKDFQATLNIIEEILDQFVKDPQSGINRNSPAVIEKEKMKDEIRNIENAFRQVSMMIGLKTLKTPGEVNFKRIDEQMGEVLREELKLLEEERQQILDRKAIGPVQAIKSKLFSLMDKAFRQKLEDKVKDDEAWIQSLKQIEMEIMKKKMLLEGGLSFDDEALTKYMNAVTDPESLIYIGSQNVFSQNNIMQGLMLDAGIASVSNSDLLISSMTQLLKNAEAEARINLINGFIEMDFDKMREKVLKRFSVEQLNDKLTEIRTIKVFNRETNRLEDKQQLYFVKPYSEAYEQKFKEFDSVTREMSMELDRLKGEKALIARDKGQGSPEAIAALDLYLAKVKEKQEYEKQHLQWMLENSSMEYKDEFYQLQQLMPAEIREEMNKLIHEKENLLYMINKESDIYFDDQELDRIFDIERRIKALRTKAAEENPEYKAYLEKSKEYYTYEPNWEYYQRAEASMKAKFSGTENQHLLQKWYDMNSIIRPTDEWYKMREALYNERADIMANDKDVSDLIDRRSRIVRQYRINGKLRLQLLTDEDAQELHQIEMDMDALIAAKSESTDVFNRSLEDKRRLREINQELMRIQTKRLSESFRDTLNQMNQDLRKAINNVNIAKNELEKAERNNEPVDRIEELRQTLDMMATAKYEQEKEFENWYNKTHYDVYRPLELGFDPKAGKPREFAYEKYPSESVEAQFTERVPSQKYTLRKVKKDVIGNPDYLKSRDGIPMPKGVIKNADGSYSISASASNVNVNQKYLELAGDNDLMEFYNKMMKLSFSLQDRVTGEKLGYGVPGYAASSVENMAREGLIGSFEKNWEIFQDKVLKTHGSFQDEVSNEFGDQALKDDIRNRFVRQLPLNLQSRDGVGSLIRWTEEAHMNIAMAEVAPQTDMFIDYMKLLAEDIEKQFQSGSATVKNPDGSERHVDMRKRFNELQNVISIMEFERRKFIKGQSEIENSSFDRKMKKMMNNVFTWTSFARIGFDLANQTKNMISGNVQAFLAAGVGESAHYRRKDLLWAKNKVYNGPDSFFANYFRDWGNLSDVGHDTLLYRRMNPLQKDFGKYLTEITGTKGRRLTGKMLNPIELSFAMQDKGDTEIGLTVMYAIMNRYTFPKIKSYNKTTGEKVYETDEKGEIVRVPAHQAYIDTRKARIKNPNLKIEQDGFILDPNVEYTEADETRLRNIIYSEVRRAQGNYASADKTKFEEGILGRLVFFYRKYLVPTFLNRFGYLRPNWESGDAALGYWRAMIMIFRFHGAQEGIKHLFMGGFTDLNARKSMGGDKAGAFLTERAAHASRDMMMMAFLTFVGSLVLSYVKAYEDDDEEEVTFKEFALFNIFRIIWGVKGEATSMFPLGGGSQEYIRNFTTLTTFTRELNTLKNTGAHLFNHSLNLFINGMDVPTEYATEFAKEVYKDSHYMRKYGRFDKGDPKLLKDFYDLTGIKNFMDLGNPMHRIDQLQRMQ